MDKFNLYFKTEGDPQGIPIIFIHAFPMTHAMWEPQLKALPSKYFGLAYDIRGIGKSPVGDGQYTMEMFVDDLLALMDHLKISSAVLCGLSLGGYIALRFAEKFPDRLKGLVLCNTRSEADTNEGKLNRAESIKTIKSEGGLSAYAKKFIPNTLSSETKRDHPEVLDLLNKLMVSQSPLGVCGAQLAMISRTDTTEFVSHISCPSLVIHGEEDALIPINQAEKMSQRIPNCRLVALSKTGHISNLENPKLFNQALFEFLEKI